MSLLARIHRGKQPLPPRLVLYGTEGIGKSSFAAQAPAPIFIQTEDGLSEIDCDKFPLATTLDEVTTSLTALHAEQHEYQSVVIDNLDWCCRRGLRDGLAPQWPLAGEEWRLLLDTGWS